MSTYKPVGPCCQCKAEIYLPSELYIAAQHSSKVTFYCAYGHPQCFVEGESEEKKLRRERDRLKQQLAEKEDTIAFWKNRTNEIGNEKAKLMMRVKHGVCPCCHRTFAKLAAHMKTKHPDFRNAAVA